MLKECQGANQLPLNYNYQLERMTQLFSRPLFIKYLHKEKRPRGNQRAQAYIDLDGNCEADDISDILIEEDLIDDKLEPEVVLDMVELPDQFGQPDIGRD